MISLLLFFRCLTLNDSITVGAYFEFLVELTIYTMDEFKKKVRVDFAQGSKSYQSNGRTKSRTIVFYR